MPDCPTSSGPSPSPAGKALSDWQNQNESRRAVHGRLMRRLRRAKALKRGEADPIFEPFSKRLAPGFREAIGRFMAERKARLSDCASGRIER
jgi:hypothetical protein